jgi:hypothetical protein
MARMDAEASRPIDDPAPIRDFPKFGRPLVYVVGIYGKAVGWTHKYGLIEWLDSSGKYHMGWAHSSSIKRVQPEEWKGSSRHKRTGRGLSACGTAWPQGDQAGCHFTLAVRGAGTTPNCFQDSASEPAIKG